MSNNIVNVGSVNIAQLGFLAYFDLDAQVLLLDITGQTVFNGAGASNVVGIAFNITGPGGLVLHTADFTAPDILPAVASTFQIALPGIYGMFGFYQVQAQIKDADLTVYSTALIIKEITKPEGYSQGSVPGNIELDADCDIPQLLVTENTIFTYQQLSPAAISKAGTLSYPRGTLADLNFTATPFLVYGAGFVYTGRYTVSNKTTVSYDTGDGISVKVPYVVNQMEQVVECDTALSALICCVEEVKSRYDRDPFSAMGKAAKEKLDQITISFYMALLKEKAGQDASAEIAFITSTLKCDCGCGSKSIEPRPMIGSGLSGLTLDVVALAGSNAAAVTNATSGSTKTFSILVKNVDVVNSLNDLAFTITKGVSGTQITYGVTFNYPILAESILTAIQNNTALTDLLQQIVAAANTGLSLAGLNSSCILTIGNCGYALIEPTTPAKTITSITIAGTVHAAPGGLLLSDQTGIAAWLNGLGLGTFAATYDSGTLTTLIETLANPNAVTQLTLAIGSNTLIRQFTKTCIGLVPFLNAITTYVCAIDTTKIAFGVLGQRISSFSSGLVVTSTAIDPAILLSGLISEILASQAALYNAFTQIALNCANIKTLFAASVAAVTDTDFLLGTKGGACARLSFEDVAAQLLADIAATPALQAAFCAIASGCVAPSCDPVTTASASLAAGTLTVNCNNASPSTSLQIRYRLNGSGGSYTNVTILASALPYAITSLGDGQYEVGINKLCTNGQYSGWVTTFSQACAPPVSFAVTDTGTQFQVAATLSGSQTKITVQMTDPNGGVQVFTHDFGAVSGTFNIPYVGGVYGNYTFIALAICDALSTPEWDSAYTSPVTVNRPNPVPNNFTASASYGLSFTDISDGTATGVPASFNGATITGTQSGYTPNLSAGTISVTIAGTLPIGTTVHLNLVENNTTVIQSVLITGPGTYILTNPSGIAAPNSIQVSIVTP